jgi:hypothetical protein
MPGFLLTVGDSRGDRRLAFRAGRAITDDVNGVLANGFRQGLS